MSTASRGHQLMLILYIYYLSLLSLSILSTLERNRKERKILNLSLYRTCTRGQIRKCPFYMGFSRLHWIRQLKMSTSGQTPPPPRPPICLLVAQGPQTPPYPVDEPVFAVWRTLAGRLSTVAPCCRDLSGRIGVRGVAVLDEPAVAAAGGAKVIKLKEHAGIDRRA